MSRSFRDWLSEGEAIYNEALKEYHALEAQLQELEARLIEKKTEVNQIAHMIGKHPVEATARVTAEVIDREMPSSMPVGSVTRALTGRGMAAR